VRYVSDCGRLPAIVTVSRRCSPGSLPTPAACDSSRRSANLTPRELAFLIDIDHVGHGAIASRGRAVVGARCPSGSGRGVHHEPLTARWWAATALAVAGVILLIGAGSAAHVRPGGVVLALAAGLCHATYTVAAKGMLAAGDPAEMVMARIFGIGALGLFPVLIFNQPGDLASAGGIALAIYLGAIPTALAYVLFARRLRHLPAGEVATLTLTEPLTAAALSAVSSASVRASSR
jgi:EamA-like transporter family